MDNQLKPCPFCGGEAIFNMRELDESYGARIGFWIMCTKCHATNPDSKGVVTVRIGSNGEMYTERDDRPKAIEVWNRRPENG